MGNKMANQTKKCCGTCRSWIDIEYLLGDDIGIVICDQLKVATSKNDGRSCSLYGIERRSKNNADLGEMTVISNDPFLVQGYNNPRLRRIEGELFEVKERRSSCKRMVVPPR